MFTRSPLAFIACLTVLLALAASATAAPPANDLRESATALPVPQSVIGATTEAALEDGEPVGNCAYGSKASVWYRVSGVRGDVALAIQAAGEFDASITVFRVERSAYTELDCANTDRNGFAAARFRASSGGVYLVRVAERASSVAGTFTLRSIRAVDEDPAPRRLPAGGRADTVNYAANPSDAWSVKLRSGVTYRINLATPHGDYCVQATLSREDRSKRLDCNGGYALFTPRAGEGGRYTIHISTRSRTLANQRYRIQVARAGRDDTGPGLFWGGGTRRGHIDGDGIDVADLYYWRLNRRSIVELRAGDFDVTLLSPSGRTLAVGWAGEPIERKLAAGQYYVMVSSSNEQSGNYGLRRVERVITSTSVTINGSRGSVSSPGGVTVTGRVTPAVGGTIELTIDRFDPVFGWQFFRRVARSAGGSLSTSFSTSGPGRWRAKAVFKGTRRASRSQSGYARLKVTG